MCFTYLNCVISRLVMIFVSSATRWIYWVDGAEWACTKWEIVHLKVKAYTVDVVGGIKKRQKIVERLLWIISYMTPLESVCSSCWLAVKNLRIQQQQVILLACWCQFVRLVSS